MAINRQKISQMTPKGADLDPTDLLEVSVDTGSGYETRSITGQEIINAASSGGTVTSVDLTMPSAFSVSGNPITTAGTLAVTGAGLVSQYVRGDGSLANFPSSIGGGASTSYYLNGSVNQGTIGGVTYYEMNKTPILGIGTDFSRNTNGYIASFLTDANDPALLKIPGGNWNLEIYFSASSGGGTPTFYVELYKYDGATFTLIASSSTNPDPISGGTSTEAYFTTLAVPETTLTLTDRLAFRIYVTPVGRTITLHTEDNNLCQIITTFTTGLTALNGLTSQVQNFATGTSGTDFGITSSSATHTFNLPTASAINTGKLSSTDWSTFNSKQNALTLTTTGTSGAATLIGSTLNVPQYAGGLTFFTEAQNTTAPNATTPVDSLTAVSVATNADFAIIPKGNGAILADIPDGAVTGGNKRGTSAVDLQMSRLINTEIASGNSSVISGGFRNIASGLESSVGGGNNNQASGAQSRVGGGNQNTASNEFATVGGGTNNTATASRTTVAGGSSCTATAYAASTLGGFGNVSTNNYASNLGGQSNTASGQYASVLGGASNSASGSYSLSGGANCVANSNFSIALGYGATVNAVIGRHSYGNLHTSTGDAQYSSFILRTRTTGNTVTILTSDGAGAASNNQIILSNQSAYRFKGTIIAKQSGSVNSAAWDVDGFIVRGANAAATTLNVSNVTLIQNTPGWGTPTLSADTTQGGLRIQIQGAAATNIQWVGDIKTTEVIYA